MSAVVGKMPLRATQQRQLFPLDSFVTTTTTTTTNKQTIERGRLPGLFHVTHFGIQGWAQAGRGCDVARAAMLGSRRLVLVDLSIARPVCARNE